MTQVIELLKRRKDEFLVKKFRDLVSQEVDDPLGR